MAMEPKKIEHAVIARRKAQMKKIIIRVDKAKTLKEKEQLQGVLEAHVRKLKRDKKLLGIN